MVAHDIVSDFLSGKPGPARDITWLVITCTGIVHGRSRNVVFGSFLGGVKTSLQMLSHMVAAGTLDAPFVYFATAKHRGSFLFLILMI